MSLEQCRLIDLPKINDPRGNLTFIESDKHIPFEIKRVYYLYDVPGGVLCETDTPIKHFNSF